MIRLRLFGKWYELNDWRWSGGDSDVRSFIQSVSDLEALDMGYAPDPEMALASAVSNKVFASDIDVTGHEPPIVPQPPRRDPRLETDIDPITIF